MNSNENVFLIKISEKIKQGDYDKFLTIPFMTKELLISTIKAKLVKRTAKGMAPVLTDSEVMLCISEVKDTAVEIFATFLKNGFIEKVDDRYVLSESGKNALKQCAIKNVLGRE